MSSRDDEARRAHLLVLTNRLGSVRDVLRMFDAGQMSEAKAISLIEDIASGEADRIVRVGQEYKPEIQS